jgi:cysteine-rich repeat protein
VLARRAVLAAALFLCAQVPSSPVTGQVQPGDLLIPEVEPGSVVNVRDGGDFTGVPRFASGLLAPSSICFGPGDRVFVTVGSKVEVINRGGDLSVWPLFASGLARDGRLACTDSEIFQGSNANGRVFDISAGGSFFGAEPFATGLGALAAIFRDSNGTLWASVLPDEIYDISAGGDFSSAVPFAAGAPVGGIAEYEGRLLVATGAGVLDFTDGGNLALAPLFAVGLDAEGLLGVPGLGLFAASGAGGGVWEISGGGDFSTTPPFATGVETSLGLASLAYVHGCGDSVLGPGEECDDGNVLNGDACNSQCLIGAPEPAQWLLLAVGALVMGLFRRTREA